MSISTEGAPEKRHRSNRLVPSKDALALRIPEACALIGIGRSSLYRLIDSGKVKTVHIGGRPSDEQAAHPATEGHTAAAKEFVYDEIASGADYTESFFPGLREAARRRDRARTHGYLVDIKRDVDALIAAYGRIASLEKLGGGK
jgi:hypothetical protein